MKREWGYPAGWFLSNKCRKIRICRFSRKNRWKIRIGSEKSAILLTNTGRLGKPGTDSPLRRTKVGRDEKW
jgi:hypothetical protein